MEGENNSTTISMFTRPFKRYNKPAYKNSNFTRILHNESIVSTFYALIPILGFIGILVVILLPQNFPWLKMNLHDIKPDTVYNPLRQEQPTVQGSGLAAEYTIGTCFNQGKYYRHPEMPGIATQIVEYEKNGMVYKETEYIFYEPEVLKKNDLNSKTVSKLANKFSLINHFESELYEDWGIIIDMISDSNDKSWQTWYILQKAAALTVFMSSALSVFPILFFIFCARKLCWATDLIEYITYLSTLAYIGLGIGNLSQLPSWNTGRTVIYEMEQMTGILITTPWQTPVMVWIITFLQMVTAVYMALQFYFPAVSTIAGDSPTPTNTEQEDSTELEEIRHPTSEKV